ncbi:MAG: DUF4250 domain-containing protein [Lachnospiraceae bacterium]|nr:DUF4250 domain-containing protein [Lachnospiraceae bacterium]
MYLPTDPEILLSVINTKLRDYYGSLNDLCDTEDIDEEELTGRLAASGYIYDREQNRFRSVR